MRWRIDVLKDYDEIIEACTYAWKSFIADAERMKSICHRDKNGLMLNGIGITRAFQWGATAKKPSGGLQALSQPAA
ncbi:hypothetical protein [Aeromonas encheleia]|uniref:hypothetical protein n=1 Tax=Aeromonas encheleia TaxID=73010 RepID=UPI003F7B8B03